MRVGESYRIFGTVIEIKKGKLMCLVKAEIPSRSRMASVMTLESLKELGIRKGDQVMSPLRPNLAVLADWLGK